MIDPWESVEVSLKILNEHVDVKLLEVIEITANVTVHL